ncbi:uncharacterized protein [Dysidea avara]|uniref:uncharacterized protein n=1 Tax=Dysidea avara TaxID=196820 RepID=UPI003319087A
MRKWVCISLYRSLDSAQRYTLGLLLCVYQNSQPGGIAVAENVRKTAPTHPLTVTVQYKHPKSLSISRTTSIERTDLEASVVPSRSRGYLLAVRIMEQQTTGAKNVLQLGCLALSMGLGVVEPYAENSFFFYPLSIEQMNLEQSFSDYYSSQSVKMNYRHAKFDSWETFLNNAPKQVIFVKITYDRVPFASRATVVPVDNCHTASNLKNFMSRNGFILVRCINYIFTNQTGHDVKLTDPEEFSSAIFGPYHPSQVNVILGKWKGLGTRTRIPLNTNCRNIYSRHLMPSEALLSDSSKYIHSYLGNNEFISVMLRTEKVILHSDGDNVNYYSKELSDCYDKVRKTVDKLQRRYASSTPLGAFVTVDVGLFGTNGDPHYQTGKHMPITSPVYRATIQFMREMYGGSPDWSLEQWEQTFLSVLGDKNDTGYIAGLQRTIATKGTCLIVVGGGSFQQLSVDLFENFHQEQKQKCLYKVCWT